MTSPSLINKMSALAQRGAKRLRISLPSHIGWICRDCRRTFTCTNPALQQPHSSSSQNAKQDEKTTHFGFETVAESLKASRVADVFSSVASSYDTMNDLMSLGIHRLWKDHFVRSLKPGIPPSTISSHQPLEGQKILDIAGGTGDIAFRLLDYATHINRDTKTSVVVSDINPDMLAEGKKRFASSPYKMTGRVSFLEANAENLDSIESNTIDLYTVAFGIRNFTHKSAAIREAFRVLKPGGVFACLEFTPQLRNPVLNALYKRWSFDVIPLIGQVVAADRDSYQYLVESIERFPTQEEFANMIKQAGFLIPGETPEDVQSGKLQSGWEDLSMGIAAIHKGVKPI